MGHPKWLRPDSLHPSRPSRFLMWTHPHQPYEKTPSNIIENEDLACERFQTVVLDKDINTCYNMSLKEFEHSGVHDFFKVCISTLSFGLKNFSPSNHPLFFTIL